MLVVFDLDLTLWNCGGTWCDHTNPPYKKISENLILDSHGRKIHLFDEVEEILQLLKSKQIPMALASRTDAPSWARQLLKLFDIEHYFIHAEIYPGSKVAHFEKIKKVTGVSFEEMFFFDDEYRNVYDVAQLGVSCHFVEDGLTMKTVKNALSW
jgi:magnesium-dependent phosphatase 1